MYLPSDVHVVLGCDHASSSSHPSGLGRRTLHCRPMDRYRRNTSTFLTRLAHGLGRKHRPISVAQASLELFRHFFRCPRWETAANSCSSDQPQYELLDYFFRSNINPPRRSFKTPSRTHPFHPLSHLPGTAVHRSLCTTQSPPPVRYCGQRSPPEAHAVSAAVGHDVQGDAVLIAAVDMGTPRVPGSE